MSSIQGRRVGPWPESGQDGPEWTAWTWTNRHRGGWWMGILLMLLGIWLLIEQVAPDLNFGTLFLLAVGLGFAAAWIVGGVKGATMPALLVIAYALAGLVVELHVAQAGGWTPLFLGVALVVAWVVGIEQHVNRTWALWVGLVLGAYGLTEVSAQFPALPNVTLFWPLLLIVVGVLLLFRRRFAGLAQGPHARVLAPTVDDGQATVRRETPDLRETLDRLLRGIRNRVAPDIYLKVASIRRSILATAALQDTADATDPNVYLIQKTAVDYLPAALQNYLKLPRAYAETRPVQGTQTAHDVLLEQLQLMDDKLGEVSDDISRHDTDRLLSTCRFLAAKFGPNSLDLGS